jgi:hypothetical protein
MSRGATLPLLVVGFVISATDVASCSTTEPFTIFAQLRSNLATNVLGWLALAAFQVAADRDA